MGLVILGVVIGYAIVTIIVIIIAVKIVPRKKWKRASVILVILISILIPTWDIPIGRINFDRLCQEQAGQFIYKQASLGEEYYLKSGERNYLYSGNSLNAYAKGGEINLEKVKENYVIKTRLDKHFSRWGHIFMRETTISSKEDNEILSRAISFYYRSGWLGSRLMDGRVGGTYCPRGAIATKNRPYSIHTNLPEKTFIKIPGNGKSK